MFALQTPIPVTTTRTIQETIQARRVTPGNIVISPETQTIAFELWIYDDSGNKIATRRIERTGAAYGALLSSHPDVAVQIRSICLELAKIDGIFTGTWMEE